MRYAQLFSSSLHSIQSVNEMGYFLFYQCLGQVDWEDVSSNSANKKVACRHCVFKIILGMEFTNPSLYCRANARLYLSTALMAFPSYECLWKIGEDAFEIFLSVTDSMWWIAAGPHRNSVYTELIKPLEKLHYSTNARHLGCNKHLEAS